MIQYKSHLPNTDGCVIIGAIPNSPPFPSRPQKLDETDFKRYVVPKQLADNVKRHSKCQDAFTKERKRADSGEKEARFQNHLVQDYHSLFVVYVGESQTFMREQQKK